MDVCLVMKPISILFFKGKDSVPPSSIEGGCMKESSVSITLILPVDPRLKFPKVFFTFED